MQIYLARENNKAGPFKKEQVSDMIRENGVEKTDMFWYEGLSAWKCLGMASEYEADFVAATKAETPAVAGEEPTSPSSNASSRDGVAVKKPVSTEPLPSVEAAAPIPYNPNGVPAPNQESFEDFDIKKETVLASRRVRLGAAVIDGAIIWMSIWLLSAILLPNGLSIMNLAGRGGSQSGTQMQINQQAFEADLKAYRNDITEEEFAQVLEQHTGAASSSAGLSIADRLIVVN
ncbi:MAG: hypothetical protein ACI9R3_000706 [Verrucomicrobiales bacterium]|jgi:hypothetical protein